MGEGLRSNGLGRAAFGFLFLAALLGQFLAG